ncbi:hypothetical protein M5K25_023291 [Dendrobium thyrsiflorum]|uniref:DUF4283 domain-containing protein n=1 Tax=Dendrobium thyrsiflorum TaxID=117978 RepID=A0ABD0UEI2_DENTH
MPGRSQFFASKSSSRFFRDALYGSSSSSSLSNLQISSHRGMPSLWILEEILALATPFEFALVGKFSSRKPSLGAIRKFFFNLKLNGDFSVTVLNPKHVLIKLLFKWSPSFDVEVESPIFLIWVSFPNLRPHLFSLRILHELGSMFGCPLKIDHATSSGSRPSVARVLVELDVTKTFLDKVWVGPRNFGYIQSVVMEAFPSYCFHCKSLGHSKFECHILHPHLAKAPIVVNKVNEIISELPIADANVHWHVSVLEPLVVPDVGIADGSVVIPVVVEDALNPPANVLVGVPGLADCSLVVSPTVVVNGFVSGDKPLEVFVGECDVNKVLSVESSKLGIPFETSPLTVLDSTLNAPEPVQFVDVSVSLISNDALKTHVASKLLDSPIDHTDWLYASSNSEDWVGDTSVDTLDDFHELYSLQMGHVVDKIISISAALLVWIVLLGVFFLARAMMWQVSTLIHDGLACWQPLLVSVSCEALLVLVVASAVWLSVFSSSGWSLPTFWVVAVDPPFTGSGWFINVLVYVNCLFLTFLAFMYYVVWSVAGLLNKPITEEELASVSTVPDR